VLDYIQANFSNGTRKIYNCALQNFQVMVGPNCMLTNMSMRHVDKFKTERMRRLGPNSVNIELRTLRAAFNIAKRWDLIEQNPFSNVKLARVPEREPVFFSKDDLRKLLAAIKEDWLKAMVVLALYTGMRRAEITNLRWQDVDFERKTIRVESNATFKTKQGKRRIIPLADTALNLLQVRQLTKRNEYVFTLNGRKIYDNWVTHKFKFYLNEVNLNDRLHFHSLRHTFASWLVQDGVSLFEVQKLMGHSNISVTQVYSHLLPETLHSTVNKINLDSDVATIY